MKAKKEKSQKSTIKKTPETARPKRKYHFPVLKRTVEAESYAEALKIVNNK
jgi:hypothetical protein